MVVDRLTRYVALRRVFRALHEEGHLLHAEDVAREWRKTGLRQSDLDSALREAIERRHLFVREGSGKRDYELTGAGFWEFVFPGRMLFDAHVWLQLIRAKVRILRGRWSRRPAHDRRLARA